MDGTTSAENILPIGQVFKSLARARKRRTKKVALFKRGDTFWVRFTTDKYKQVRFSLGTTNEEIAMAKRAQYEVELYSNKLKLPTNISIDDFLQEYFEYCRIKKTKHTFRTEKNFIMSFVRDRKIARVRDITFNVVSSYLTIYAKNHSPVTVNNIRAYLHAMLSYAVDHEYAMTNPVSKVKRFKEPQRTIRFLKDKDEIENFLKLFENDFLHPMVATFIYAGLRREEACWLCWEDIDFKRKLIYIRAKEIEGEEWCPKTKKPRVVPINSKLFKTLSYHRNRSQNQNGWVFPSPKGFRWQPENLTHRFERIVRKAGLNYTLLDLRHTFGSQLAMKGVSLYKIATLMGNSPEICRKHYASLIPEQLHEEVEF